MIYDRYAQFYDRTGQLRFSILTANYLPNLLAAHPVAGHRLLDLACGTGTFALMQAEAGYTVTGIDQSPQMLKVAERKAQASNSVINWQHCDLRNLQLAGVADLATCWYDSLNYLVHAEEIYACLRGVYAALRPGGLFCFDVATPYFLRHYWQGVEVYEEPNYFQVTQSHYTEGQQSTLVLTGFAETAPGRWDRFQETHVERAYPADFWRTALLETGWTVEACYDCFTRQPPNAKSLRWCWVARRRKDEG